MQSLSRSRLATPSWLSERHAWIGSRLAGFAASAGGSPLLLELCATFPESELREVLASSSSSFEAVVTVSVAWSNGDLLRAGWECPDGSRSYDVFSVPHASEGFGAAASECYARLRVAGLRAVSAVPGARHVASFPREVQDVCLTLVAGGMSVQEGLRTACELVGYPFAPLPPQHASLPGLRPFEGR